MMLADHGAQVIKIQQTQWDPLQSSNKPYFNTINRNKKSLKFNTNSNPKQIIKSLVQISDIIVQTPPRLKNDYNLHYQQISQLNPKIIYCQLSPFGQSSPNNNSMNLTPDQQIQTFSGMMKTTGYPKTTGGASSLLPYTDIISSHIAYTSILIALLERSKSGKGQKITSSSLHSMLYSQVNLTMGYLNVGEEIQRLGNRHTHISAAGVYKSRDNVQFVISPNTQTFFNHLVEELQFDVPEKWRSNQQRIDDRDEFQLQFEKQFKKFNFDQLLDKFNKIHLPYTKINTFSQAIMHEQARSLGVVAEQEETGQKYITFPTNYSEINLDRPVRAPKHGEHTQQILKYINKNHL